MAATTRLRNPYIAGRALGQQQGFFGRDDIFRLVETELALPDQNAVVLFGQRRIGKTSILRQLQYRLASLPFLPVYFDLMDRARRPLGQVLHDIASTIAAEIDIAMPGIETFDDEGISFRQVILPALYSALGADRRPVLLFDEFDVLDVAAEEQLPPTAAARAFFPYLRQLMQGEPRLAFVFVVGRRAEDLSIDVKATFKATRYKRVSVLETESARELILTATRQGTLDFTEAAVDRILALTAGHPYFIQLLCQILWDTAHTEPSQDTLTIDTAAVEATIPKVIEAGLNVFEWIWEGLPSAERVIFAAIAEATDEGSVVTEEQLLELLQRHGIRILTRQLELAPSTLVEWELVQQADGGYCFFIELIRLWVAQHKPLPKVKEELDRIDPLADTLYRSGDGFYRQRELGSAQNQLAQALRLNPNHLKARLLLGQILVEQGKLTEAVRELEEAYRYDEDASRYPLVRTLLVRAEEFKRTGKDDDELAVYDRVLEISPHEKVAQEHRAAIWIKRGDQAVKADDLATALIAYQKANAHEKIADIETIHSRRQKMAQLYAEGVAASQQQNWPVAMRSFAEVVYIQPDYNDAAERLARVVRKQKSITRLIDRRLAPVNSTQERARRINSRIGFLIVLAIATTVGFSWATESVTAGLGITLGFIVYGFVGWAILKLITIILTFMRTGFMRDMPGTRQRWAEENYRLAQSPLAKKEVDRAIVRLSNAIKFDPNHVRAYYERGLAHVSKGDKDKAIFDFRKVLELSDEDALRYPAREQLRALGATETAES